MDEAKWYVIHTFSGHENKVASNLEKMVENRDMHDLIQEILVPTETYTEVKDGVEKVKVRKLYPGYVFIKMVVNDDTWYMVRNIYGCTGFVGPGAKPTPLTPEEVKNIEIGSVGVEVPYKVGDSVEIIDGPLKDLVGAVKDIFPAENKVSIVISIMGRETPVDLELKQVKLVD